MNEYSILSAIYKILSDTAQETLNQLEKVGQQPEEILAVVRALKNARAAMDNKYMRNGARVYVSTTTTGPPTTAGKRAWSKQTTRLWKSLKTALAEPKGKGQKARNQAVIDAFLESGLKTDARAKEGRQKILVMLEASLDAIDDSKRVKIFEGVTAGLGLSQTKGWVDAIRSKNH